MLLGRIGRKGRLIDEDQSIDAAFMMKRILLGLMGQGEPNS
jgi:hypothetical protein